MNNGYVCTRDLLYLPAYSLVLCIILLWSQGLSLSGTHTNSNSMFILLYIPKIKKYHFFYYFYPQLYFRAPQNSLVII